MEVKPESPVLLSQAQCSFAFALSSTEKKDPYTHHHIAFLPPHYSSLNASCFTISMGNGCEKYTTALLSPGEQRSPGRCWGELTSSPVPPVSWGMCLISPGLSPILELWSWGDTCGSVPLCLFEVLYQSMSVPVPCPYQGSRHPASVNQSSQSVMHAQQFVKFPHMTPPSPGNPPHVSSQRSWTLKGPGEKRNKTLNNLFWRNSQWRGTNNVSLKEAGPLTLPFSLGYLKA